MATENQRMVTSLLAAENLDSARYHAVALDDGKLANTAEEASGILLNKPKSGEFATLGYIGEMAYAAGAAITKGAKLTVTTSGWFTTAGSSDVIIGEAKVTVTSGSLGTGYFVFTNVGASPENTLVSITPVTPVVQGACASLRTKTVATTALTAQAIAQTAASSGIANGNFMLFGKGIGYVTTATSVGDLLVATTSGYLTTCLSGYYPNAIALANISSGTTGSIFFSGVMGMV